MSSCFLKQPSNGVIVNRPSTCGLAPHSRLFGGLWDVGRVPRGVRITHRLPLLHAYPGPTCVAIVDCGAFGLEDARGSVQWC